MNELREEPSRTAAQSTNGQADAATSNGTLNGQCPANQVFAPLPEDVARFFGTIFAPDDWVLIRPIESFTKDGKKYSLVCHDDVRHTRASDLLKSPSRAWAAMSSVAITKRANIFFGVCPRFMGTSSFDRAFQIRVVRVLWADLDNCTQEEAIRRCQAAGLPHASIVVKSGHGVHLYWLLNTPYLIDDIGDPPSITTAYVKRADGSKRPPRHFVTVNGDKIFEYPIDPKTGLDRKTRNPEFPDDLSCKARHVQHVLNGIAAKIGGDHTGDLARSLRVPSTLNRKDERNGAPPVPCELVECDPSRRYSFAEFERFAEHSPARLHEQELAKVRLPKRKLTPTRLNKLFDHINRCAVATLGERSEADFALCCYSIRQGFDREEVWSQVSGVGKFAERGRNYFERTWTKADSTTRGQLYDLARRKGKHGKTTETNNNGDKLTGHDNATTPIEVVDDDPVHKESSSSDSCAAPSSGAADGRKIHFANFYEVDESEGETPKIIRHGYPIQHLTTWLTDHITDGWPKRIGELLFAQREGEPLYLDNPNSLFAWIAGHLPGNLVVQESGKPTNPLVWAKGPDMVSQERLFAFLAQTAEGYDTLERMPHWPSMPATFYMHPTPAGDGRSLDELLHRYCPATDTDCDLILAFLLSLFWGGQPGQRPAWLFTAEDGDDPQKGRGVGKTKLAEGGAELTGGAIMLSPNEEYQSIMTRLLSPDAITRRVALIDNIKTLKFSWAELESLITCQTISGKRLYHGEGRRPNTLTWILTLNGASLSKDMAQRCVIVKLQRPQRQPRWEEETLAFIRERRWQIIGDIIAELQRPTDPMKRHSRWGAWEDAVLAKVGDPGEAQKVIEERQGVVDDDAGEAALVRAAFADDLRDRGHTPERAHVFIPSKVAAQILNDVTMERRPTNKANTYLGTLHIEELRSNRRSDSRGWVWLGREADPASKASELLPSGRLYSTGTRSDRHS